MLIFLFLSENPYFTFFCKSLSSFPTFFSSLDDQIQQTLAFPSDEPPLPNSAYQLANIDGAILVLPPSGNCLFELICVPIISQVSTRSPNEFILL